MSVQERQNGVGKYYLWAGGGILIGLAGVAIYYQRKKNLAASKLNPPPRSQLQMTAEEPEGPGSSSAQFAGNGSHGKYSTSSSEQSGGQGKPGNVGTDNRGMDNRGGSNGQHDTAASPNADRDSTAVPAYGWAQNQEEAYLMTTCAADVRSKEIKCDISKDRMKLSVRGDTVAAGEFYRPVDTSESTWELESMGGQKTLTVTLVKAHCYGEAEWPILLKTCPMPALNTVMV